MANHARVARKINGVSELQGARRLEERIAIAPDKLS